MGVGVDTAGKKEHFSGVESLVRGSGRNAGANFLDSLAFDEDVGLECFVSGNNGTVLDEKSHQSQFLPVTGGLDAEVERCSQDSDGRPRSICCMVMQPGTG